MQDVNYTYSTNLVLLRDDEPETTTMAKFWTDVFRKIVVDSLNQLMVPLGTSGTYTCEYDYSDYGYRFAAQERDTTAIIPTEAKVHLIKFTNTANDKVGNVARFTYKLPPPRGIKLYEDYSVMNLFGCSAEMGAVYGAAGLAMGVVNPALGTIIGIAALAGSIGCAIASA